MVLTSEYRPVKITAGRGSKEFGLDEEKDKVPSARDGAGEPQWTNGLKRLYDSVVEEPLPDSFKDLLSKLDDSGK